MPSLRYLHAVTKALRDEMTRSDEVFVMGEDVRESLRGATKGLVAEFGPARVIDTPMSEAAFVGFAIGAALSGRRPIVEFQVASLVYLAFDQVVNQAQKLRLMTGGQVKLPITFLFTGSGARVGLAAQHSDHPYPLLMQCGVKTVIPATADDAYGLLVAAIRDDDPVAYFAPSAALARRDEVPSEPFIVPLGSARVRRVGSDVTVVAVGHLVHEALEVAVELEREGVSVEVVDPRSLLPLDAALLKSSVLKTGKLVVFDDSNRTCGFAAEVIARFAVDVQGRVRRITRADVPVPFAPALEAGVLPSKTRLAKAIRELADARAKVTVGGM